MSLGDKYSVSHKSVGSFLTLIEDKSVAIPDIQRPFVWHPKDVRDFIDSLYKGYPTGYLIIWQTPKVHLKDGRDALGKQVLIDGQQRVTALMTAIVGQEILTSDYQKKVYRIAFNPIEERFAVKDLVNEKDPKWIPDISVVFKNQFSQISFFNEYIRNNPDADPGHIEMAMTKLLSIRSCQLGIIELTQDLSINEVTEIFVRINSRGKSLNSADFAMSKIAADESHGGNELRKAIDYFCHLAVDPSFYDKLRSFDPVFMQSEYEPLLRWLKDDNGDIYDPDYRNMLRVSFMHVFKRGKLSDLVELLDGRDFEARCNREEIAEQSFQNLKNGVKQFMNHYNFEQFVLAIRSAGFISSHLLYSRITLDFAYTLYLMLIQDPAIPKNEVKRWVQKMFVLSTLTGRYISSAETQMDRDIRGIGEKGFLQFFAEVESSQLPDSFWEVTLVQNMETSSVNSPYFNTFIASQIFFGDTSLLSNSSKVSDLIATIGDVHHIFPKEYLRKNGIDDKGQYNQIANYVYLDTGVNISIGKKAPNEYFSRAVDNCGTGTQTIGTITDKNQLLENLNTNCIPPEIVNMTVADYQSFLEQRRRLMAQKIKRYYQSL